MCKSTRIYSTRLDVQLSTQTTRSGMQVIESCKVGFRKPDKRVFDLALKQLGDVPPSAAVFLDDLPENLTTPREMGMHTIHVCSRA